MGFQTEIYNQPAPAEAGDFYGVNPRASMLGGPEQWSAPEGGAVVGRFLWADPNAGDVTQYYRPNCQIGFLHRENNAVITEFLAEASFIVYEGLPITLFDQGDFWGRFAAGATPGQRVWADPGDGSLIAGGASAPGLDSYTASAGFGGTAQQGAAGNITIATNVATITLTGGYVETGTVITSANVAGVALGARLTGSAGGAGTFTMVHANVSVEVYAGANDVLSVTAAAQGALKIGAVVDSTGADATVVALMSGTGGTGTYQVSTTARVASGAVTAPTDVMDVTAVVTGPLLPGDGVSVPPASSGTLIAAQLTGSAGAVGTYQLNQANYFTSQAITNAAVATPWIVNSVAAAGEVATISTWG